MRHLRTMRLAAILAALFTPIAVHSAYGDEVDVPIRATERPDEWEFVRHISGFTKASFLGVSTGTFPCDLRLFRNSVGQVRAEFFEAFSMSHEMSQVRTIEFKPRGGVDGIECCRVTLRGEGNELEFFGGDTVHWSSFLSNWSCTAW